MKKISKEEFSARQQIIENRLSLPISMEYSRAGLFYPVITILDFLLKGVKNKRILDIGCGGGDRGNGGNDKQFVTPVLSRALSGLEADMVGIDICAKPCCYPYDTFKAYRMPAESVDIYFMEGEFDAVTAIEFWNSPTRLNRYVRLDNKEQLRKIYTVLRVGGIYIDGLFRDGMIYKELLNEIGFEDLASCFDIDNISLNGRDSLYSIRRKV